MLLAIVGLICGLIAAYYWYRSSKVDIDTPLGIESVEQLTSQMGWIAKTRLDLHEAGRLNKIAALWTAASVVCGGLSSILGSY